MKKEILIVLVLTIIIVILLSVLIFVPRSYDQKPNGITGADGIIISSLDQNQVVSSPLKITGQVTGNGWAGFEGQVGTVKLLDYKGNELASGILTATTEWTALPTSFETTLSFIATSAGPATLVFRNENPSGDPIRDKTFSLPISISVPAGT